MKKWIALLLCLGLFGQGVWMVRAFAVVDTMFIAVNDELQDLNLQTSPIRVGGITYLPCTIFDSRVSGVNLGVSYGWDQKENKVSLYSIDRVVEFDLNAKTVYDYKAEMQYDYPAVVQNGMTYVPAVWSCRTFGLTASFTYSHDGEFRLLRVKNGSQVLSDEMYMRSVRPILEERSHQEEETIEVVNPEIEIPVEQEQRPDVTVYLAVQVREGEQLQALIERMEKSDDTKAVFFFSTADLIQYEETIREISGRGHRIGLVAQGRSAVEKMASLQDGNEILRHILRQKAVFVLDNGLSNEEIAQMKKAGYLPWKADVSLKGADSSGSEIYRTALHIVHRQKQKARLLFDDNTKAGTLRSILQHLEKDMYDIKMIKETAY